MAAQAQAQATPLVLGQVHFKDLAHLDRRLGVVIVVLLDQTPLIETKPPSESAQVASGIEVTTALGEVTSLHLSDHMWPDLGALTELLDAESGLDASSSQLDAEAVNACRTHGGLIRPGGLSVIINCRQINARIRALGQLHDGE